MPTPAPIRSIGPSETNSRASGLAIRPLNMGMKICGSRSPRAWASKKRWAWRWKKPEPTPVRSPVRQSAVS